MPQSAERACQALLERVRPVGVQRLPLGRCWRRILAEDVVAGADYPPFDRAQVDGYAVRAEAVAKASPDCPAELVQAGCIAAGDGTAGVLRPGTACRIMTGAPLPAGATGVARLEDVACRGDRVLVLRGDRAGENVCRRGEVIARGEKVLSAGKVVNRGVMGALALLGRSCPLVYRRPRVGILATGSELLPVGRPVAPGKIHDLNSYMLSAQIRDLGGQPVLLGVVDDDVARIRRMLERASDCDMLVMTGGLSTGDFDFARRVLESMDAVPISEAACSRPGSFLLAGEREGRLCLGLSGNPFAAGLSFEQVVAPVLLALGGCANPRRRGVRGKVASSSREQGSPRRVMWARTWMDQGEVLVEPLPRRWGEMLRSTMTANALLAVDEDAGPPVRGEDVEVIFLH